MVKGYQCDQCLQVLSTRGHLTRHMKRHNGVKVHECPIVGCDYKSARKDNRNVHFDSHKRKLQKAGIDFQLKEMSFVPHPLSRLPSPETICSPVPLEMKGDLPFIYPYPSPNEYYYNYYPQEIYTYPQDYGYEYSLNTPLPK
jgi:hypothetical protein